MGNAKRAVCSGRRPVPSPRQPPIDQKKKKKLYPSESPGYAGRALKTGRRSDKNPPHTVRGCFEIVGGGGKGSHLLCQGFHPGTGRRPGKRCSSGARSSSRTPSAPCATSVHRRARGCSSSYLCRGYRDACNEVALTPCSAPPGEAARSRRRFFGPHLPPPPQSFHLGACLLCLEREAAAQDSLDAIGGHVTAGLSPDPRRRCHRLRRRRRRHRRCRARLAPPGNTHLPVNPALLLPDRPSHLPTGILGEDRVPGSRATQDKRGEERRREEKRRAVGARSGTDACTKGLELPSFARSERALPRKFLIRRECRDLQEGCTGETRAEPKILAPALLTFLAASTGHVGLSNTKTSAKNARALRAAWIADA